MASLRGKPPVVSSTLYVLRHNAGAGEYLGDEIYLQLQSPGSGTTLGETNQLHGRINISFAIKRALLDEIYLMSDTMNTKSIHLCCVYIAILPYDFTRYSLAFVSKASILNSPLSPLHSHRPASSRRR